ncbi:MAG: permease-like cell division protein FtsX [Candidatus Ancillula sp.]|jgi:cell division transport system permease protein|nr:permease-like cell division protein FtsX [Candidatus Ancillula sp.]
MRSQFILSEVFQNLRRNVFMSISVILVTFISLVFVGAAGIFQMQITKSKGDWYDKVEVAVYLCPDYETSYTCPTGEGATDADVDKVKKIIASDLKDDVEGVTVETKDQAFEKFKERYPGGVFKGQTLTAADMQITLHLKLKNPEDYKVVSEVLSNREGIQTVSDQRKLFEPIFNTLNSATVVAMVLAVLMILSAVLLIATTIRLSAASRRKETEIMRLVGASNLFIQLPFILEGAFSAVVGAIAASGFLSGVVSLALNNWASDSVKWIDFVKFGDIWPIIPLLIIIAILISVISSAVTLKKYTKI